MKDNHFNIKKKAKEITLEENKKIYKVLQINIMIIV